MSDFRELYQEMILDHAKRPRNFRELPGAASAEGFNPLCGDRLTVFVEVENGRVKDAAFQGSGCAISQASASLMTETMKGRSPEEAERLFQVFHDVVTGEAEPDAAVLGKLSIFAGVRDYPTRVKCASLAWHALRNALRGAGEVATTE